MQRVSFRPGNDLPKLLGYGVSRTGVTFVGSICGSFCECLRVVGLHLDLWDLQVSIKIEKRDVSLISRVQIVPLSRQI